MTLCRDPFDLIRSRAASIRANENIPNSMSISASGTRLTISVACMSIRGVRLRLPIVASNRRSRSPRKLNIVSRHDSRNSGGYHPTSRSTANWARRSMSRGAADAFAGSTHTSHFLMRPDVKYGAGTSRLPPQSQSQCQMTPTPGSLPISYRAVSLAGYAGGLPPRLRVRYSC